MERHVIDSGRNAERPLPAARLLETTIIWLNNEYHRTKATPLKQQPFLVRDIVVDLCGGSVTVYYEKAEDTNE